MTVTPLEGPEEVPGPPALTLVTGRAQPPAVPCAARPSTGFVHLDGPCRCFAGGPAPEFAPTPLPGDRSHLSVAP